MKGWITMLKKILAVVLLLAVAVVCVACTRNTPAQTSETKKYTYTIINKTGTTVNKVYLADDHSANKAEVKFDGEGMDDGAEVSLSVSAVPDKDGNPSLTASYTIGATEYQTKVTSAAAEIKLTPEGPDAGAFEVTAPGK